MNFSPDFEIDGRSYENVFFLHYKGELFFSDGSFILSYEDFGDLIGESDEEWVTDYIHQNPGQDFLVSGGRAITIDSPKESSLGMDGELSSKADVTSFVYAVGTAYERLVFLSGQAVMFDDRLIQLLEGYGCDLYSDSIESAFLVVVNGQKRGSLLPLKWTETKREFITSALKEIGKRLEPKEVVA